MYDTHDNYPRSGFANHSLHVLGIDMKLIKLPQYCYPKLGMVLVLYAQLSGYIGIVSSLGIWALVYATFSGYLKLWFPWASFGFYVVAIVAGVLCLAMLVYILLWPSQLGWSNQQGLTHNNRAMELHVENNAMLKRLFGSDIEFTDGAGI